MYTSLPLWAGDVVSAPLESDMSGLSRRRGGGSTASAPAPVSEEENGHVIAYDPEDKQAGSDTADSPLLTLMEEVLLVGLKDDEGYLSFWNDSISYVLRGCIMIELALRNRIAILNDPMRRRKSIVDRVVEVVDDTPTGEVLLDETLRLMKTSEPMGVNKWIDCLSGETWDLTKISFQLKQVRERLAKGLVDKGVCRTEKRNFFLFDMATHPIVDHAAKEEIKRRVLALLTAPAYVPPAGGFRYFPAGMKYKTLRTISLAASAYAANVLENMFNPSAGYDTRDAALVRADELLVDYAEYPFQKRTTNWAQSLSQAVQDEIGDDEPEQAPRLELVAAVLRVLTYLDTSF